MKKFIITLVTLLIILGGAYAVLYFELIDMAKAKLHGISGFSSKKYEYTDEEFTSEPVPVRMLTVKPTTPQMLAEDTGLGIKAELIECAPERGGRFELKLRCTGVNTFEDASCYSMQGFFRDLASDLVIDGTPVTFELRNDTVEPMKDKTNVEVFHFILVPSVEITEEQLKSATITFNPSEIMFVRTYTKNPRKLNPFEDLFK